MSTWQEEFNNKWSDQAVAEQEILRAKQVYEQELANWAGQGQFAHSDRAKEITKHAEAVRRASGISYHDPNYGNDPNTFGKGAPPTTAEPAPVVEEAQQAPVVQQAPQAPQAPQVDPYQAMLRNQQMMNQQNQAKMESLTRMLQQAGEGMYSQQEAMLGQAKEAQIAQLQKAYADAVQAGQMSVREAEAQFEAKTKEIEQQAYIDAQQTELSAENRGIANSQQLLGLMAGDNARKNSMINENMTTRDRRINDVRDRINNLKTQKDLDIGLANSNYQYGLANARGQVDQMMAQQGFQMGLDDLNATRSENFQMSQAEFQRQAQMGMAEFDRETQMGMAEFNRDTQFQLTDINNRNDLNKMATQFGFTIEQMGIAQQLQLAEMAKQHGYNVDMAKVTTDLQRELQKDIIDHNGNWDLKKMAKQHGFQMSEISARSRARIAEMNKQAKMQTEAIDKEYKLAVERELAKYTKGTDEYKIMQGQLKQHRDSLKAEIQLKAYSEAEAMAMMELTSTMPTQPQGRNIKTNWNPFTGSTNNRYIPPSEEDVFNYEKSLEEYLKRSNWEKELLGQ